MRVYTDGSCHNTGRKDTPGGCGIYIPDMDIRISMQIPKSTNNIAELTAILEALKHYEKEGVVSHVVFSNGAIVKDGELFVYYGGADKVVGVAKIKLDELLDNLLNISKK